MTTSKYLVLLIFFIQLTLASATPTDNKASQEDEVIFCVTGDSRGDDNGINKKILTQTLQSLKAEHPSFVVVNGDLVSGYSSKLEKQLINWRDSFMKPLLDAGIKVYSCRGNHDAAPGKLERLMGKNSALAVWQKVFSGKYAFPDNGPAKEKGVTYFVKKKNLLLLFMDTYPGKPTHQVNLPWVEKIIKTEKGDLSMHLFAVTHEPAFAVHHTDCLASKPKERDKFLNTFTSHGGVCHLCGHDHMYNHAKVITPQGEFHQFVCGTLGAPLYKWNGKYHEKNVQLVKTEKSFGYMVVHIKGKTAVLTMKTWDDAGKLKIIDTFSYTLKESNKTK